MPRHARIQGFGVFEAMLMDASHIAILKQSQ